MNRIATIFMGIALIAVSIFLISSGVLKNTGTIGNSLPLSFIGVGIAFVIIGAKGQPEKKDALKK